MFLLLIPPAIGAVGALTALIKNEKTERSNLPGGVIKHTLKKDTDPTARVFSGILTLGISEIFSHHSEVHAFEFKNKILGHNTDEAVRTANKHGIDCLAEHKYEEAAEWFCAAYETCPPGKAEKRTCKDNMNWALAKIDNKEGERLSLQKKHAEAIVKYKAAYDKCPSSRTYDRGKYQNNEANSLNCQGHDLLDRRDYAGAVRKFSEAYKRCTGNFSGKQTFQDNIDYAKAEALNEEGERLYHRKMYAAAIDKFKEAWDQCPSNKWNSLNNYNNNKAKSLNGMGFEAYLKGNYLEAAEWFSQAFSECTGDFENEQNFKQLRDKAITQCTAEEKCREKPAYTFIEAQYLIANGILDVENPDKENTVVIGNTIGGKSTIINYLLSNSLTASKPDPDAKGKKGKVLKIYAEDPEAGPKIGASSGSMTTIPKKWHKPYAAYNKAIWDCPGFGDNRGPAIDISNACLLSKLLSNATNIRIVLVTDIDDIKSDNPAGFVDLIKQVKCLFSDLSKINSCTMLLVTKVDVDDYSVDDIVADLKQIATDVQDPDLDREFIQHLAAPEKIAIFAKPKKEGILDTEDAAVIAEAIDNINSKHKLNVKVGISPDTKVFIFENRSVLSDQLDDCLKVLSTKLCSAFDVIRIEATTELEIIFQQLAEMKNILHLNDGETNIKHLIKRIPKIFEGQKWWINYKNCITEKHIRAVNEILDLVFFVESICDQQMVHLDNFKNSLRHAHSELASKIKTRIADLKDLEHEISRRDGRTQYMKMKKN